MENLSKLRQQIISTDGEERLRAADRLASIGGDEAFNILIPVLNNKNTGIRDAAALSLRAIGNSKAVPYLVKAIRNSKDKKNCGTLVYALEKLDCSKLLLLLVKLALHGSFEVQNHALTILFEQSFKTSRGEIAKAKNMVSKNIKIKGIDKDLIKDLEKILKEILKTVSK